MALSSRIAVMDKGQVVQVGTPQDIYEYPNCRFAADFIGSINLFEGTVTAAEEGRVVVACEEVDRPLTVHRVSSVPAGARVAVAIRPEKIRIGRDEPREDAVNALRGQVLDLGYFGGHSLYRVKLPSGRIVLVSHQNRNRVRDDERQVDWDDEVWLSWPATAALVLAE